MGNAEGMDASSQCPAHHRAHFGPGIEALARDVVDFSDGAIGFGGQEEPSNKIIAMGQTHAFIIETDHGVQALREGLEHQQDFGVPRSVHRRGTDDGPRHITFGHHRFFALAFAYPIAGERMAWIVFPYRTIEGGGGTRRRAAAHLNETTYVRCKAPCRRKHAFGGGDIAAVIFFVGAGLHYPGHMKNQVGILDQGAEGIGIANVGDHEVSGRILHPAQIAGCTNKGTDFESTGEESVHHMTSDEAGGAGDGCDHEGVLNGGETAGFIAFHKGQKYIQKCRVLKITTSLLAFDVHGEGDHRPRIGAHFITTVRMRPPVDLFDKCRSFTRADEVKAMGYYPYFRAIEENEGPVVSIEGRKVIMAGSNNYLGLTAHPSVKQASLDAISRFGTGCSGSRYLTGTISLHNELEERLAAFLHKESCLLFSTGYQTAQGIIPTLVQRGDYVISDKDNHACIVAGDLMAKGAFANFERYKHNDMADLERLLASLPEDKGKLVVSDGVFSTTGEIVELDALVRACKKYGARILIDDAHSVGVIGKGGRGTASAFGLEAEVDMTMGTFSKTFASLGGFVVGERPVINYIKHHSPALIFSASPTPASVAAALAALDILEAHPEMVTRLIEIGDYMRKGFTEMGFRIIESKTAIVPVIIGEDELTFVFWKKLFDAGVFVNAFISPGVPAGLQMLRTSYMATHEKGHMDRILEIFGTIGKELGVIS